MEGINKHLCCFLDLLLALAEIEIHRHTGNTSWYMVPCAVHLLLAYFTTPTNVLLRSALMTTTLC